MPFGELSHYGEGIVEYYLEQFGVTDKKEITVGLCKIYKYGYRGHHDCPCGSGKIIRKCHKETVWEISQYFTKQELASDLVMMLDSIKEKDFKSTEEIEQKVDSLYHLSRRILFKCSKNSILRMENNIKNEEDIFFYLTIFKRIEKIADNIFTMRNENFSDNDFRLLEELLSQIDLLLSGKKRNLQKKILPKSKNKLIQKKLVKIENNFEDMIHDINFIKLNKKFIKWVF